MIRDDNALDLGSIPLRVYMCLPLKPFVVVQVFGHDDALTSSNMLAIVFIDPAACRLGTRALARRHNSMEYRGSVFWTARLELS